MGREVGGPRECERDWSVVREGALEDANQGGAGREAGYGTWVDYAIYLGGTDVRRERV